MQRRLSEPFPARTGSLSTALLAALLLSACRADNAAFREEERKNRQDEESTSPAAGESEANKNQASVVASTSEKSVKSSASSETTSVVPESSSSGGATSSVESSTSGSGSSSSSISSSSAAEPEPGYCEAPARACMLMRLVNGFIPDELNPQLGLRASAWSFQKNEGMQDHFEYSSSITGGDTVLYPLKLELDSAKGFGLDMWLQSPNCVKNSTCIFAGYDGDLVLVYNNEYGFYCGRFELGTLYQFTASQLSSTTAPIHVGCLNNGQKVQLWLDGEMKHQGDAVASAGLRAAGIGGSYASGYATAKLFAARLWVNSEGFAEAMKP